MKLGAIQFDGEFCPSSMEDIFNRRYGGDFDAHVHAYCDRFCALVGVRRHAVGVADYPHQLSLLPAVRLDPRHENHAAAAA